MLIAFSKTSNGSVPSFSAALSSAVYKILSATLFFPPFIRLLMNLATAGFPNRVSGTVSRFLT